MNLKVIIDDTHPYIKLLRDINNKSVSRLDDSPSKYKHNKNNPMDENLPKEKTHVKPGENNAPEVSVLDTSAIIGHKFLIPNQEYGQKLRVCIVKIIDDHETKL